MKEQSALFQYLKECYEVDTRTINLSNFFSRKVENRIWIDGKDEVLNGNLPYLPIREDAAEGILNNLADYPREKSLYAFAHFFVGYRGGNRICAPLIFIPARILKRDGYTYLELNLKQKFLNYNFLATIKKNDGILFEEIFDFLLKSDVVDFSVTSKISSVLEKEFTDVKADNLRMYPDLITEKKIKSKRPKNHFEVFSGMGVGVLRGSSKTLGIISELEALMSQKTISGAMNTILNPDEANSPNLHYPSKERVPAILSSAQIRILRNADKYYKSVVIGPPGTGKSFTIANLAINLLVQEKSVLIVSKTDEAVDVVYNKLVELDLETAAIRAGKSNYLKGFKLRLKNLLSRKLREPTDEELEELSNNLDDSVRKLGRLSASFEKRIKDELDWGKYLFESKDKTGVLTRLKRKYLDWRNTVKTPQWIITRDYYEAQEAYLELVSKFILLCYHKQLARFLRLHRSELRDFLKAIRARTLLKQEELFKELDFSKILKTFPIWLCNTSDLYEVLPLNENLFDHVIIDEASQCDLASIMPALQRAKKITVVGDPHQLRHFSFVSQHLQSALQRKMKISHLDDTLLDYRNSSILDLCFEQCTTNDEVTFLDEHFRGNGQLLSFSNKSFYENRLKVMKSLPVHLYKAIWRYDSNGLRDANGINKIEAEKLIQSLLELIESSQITGLYSSIGILSPFSKQREYLSEQIAERIPWEAHGKHNIMVGTPYSFQGNERDLMMVSWCIDNDTHNAAIRYLNRAEVFNVAITRAKIKMLNFVSFKNESLPMDSLLRSYMEEAENYLEEQKVGLKIADVFANEVGALLAEKGYSFKLGYDVASIPVDMLVTIGDKYKAIDFIGFPGKFYESIDLNQYLLLNRAGVSVFPFPYSYWYFDREHALKELQEFLNA